MLGKRARGRDASASDLRYSSSTYYHPFSLSIFRFSPPTAVRIRPVTNADQGNIPSRWQRNVLHPLGANSLQIEQGAAPPPASGGAASANAPGKKQTFNFDRVLSPSDGQAQVYSSVAEPLIGRFLEGYNVTILAYGQTSSGKSYTMGTAVGDVDYESLVAGQTPDPQMGIIPRAVGQIFSQMKSNMSKSGAVQYSAKASFIEIYNEDLIDLLADSDGDTRPLVQIREGKGGQIIWSGLREVKVQNVADVMNYLEQGSQIRRTNETDMNAQSSRSHAIFSLTLTQRKFVGTGPPPAPSAANSIHPPSSFGGRTTPSGTGSIGRSGLPRPASGIPSRAMSPSMNGSRPNTPSMYGGLPVPSGRNSATGLRPASVAGMRSITPSGGDASAGTQEGDWVTVTSKFHFVDLAGSERVSRKSEYMRYVPFRFPFYFLFFVSLTNQPSLNALFVPYSAETYCCLWRESQGRYLDQLWTSRSRKRHFSSRRSFQSKENDSHSLSRLQAHSSSSR